LRISVITPTLNQGEFIEDTIRSVFEQDHLDVEHIVVDGGSTDGTQEILARYPHLRWVSEEDSGQSNAINKGFRMATGDVVAWLNSDDYYDRNVLSAVSAYFETHPGCMMLYGDITYIARDRRILYSLTGDTISYETLLQSPDIVRQPSSFWRRQAVADLGGLDERLHLVMDFDLILRCARRQRPHYIARNLSFFRWYGQSKTATMLGRQARELYRVYRKNGVSLGFRQYRFLLGRYLDSLGEHNPVRMGLSLLRKRGTPA
jgi:glycosyltransferase involved in cell wall biosynthesis